VRSLILMDTSAWSFDPDDEERSPLMRAFIGDFDPTGGLPDLTALPNPEDELIAAATPAEWQARKLVLSASFDAYAFKAIGTELLLNSDTMSVRHRLAEITCPVTVIVGELDEPFVSQADDLATEVADGKVIVVPGAYHSPQLTHPDAWLAAVATHLSR
jgi:pimeloyl-ACP methyl ester carboxylesterase